MSQANIIRLLVTVAVAVYALFELFPLTDTPFRDYLVESVQAEVAPEGQKANTLEENRAEFAALLQRADALVAENKDNPRNPYPSIFVALQEIANRENLDLNKYFDLPIKDIVNLRKRNDLLMREMLRRSKGEIRLGLDLNGGVAATFEVDERGLPDNIFQRRQILDDARGVIVDRVDGLGVAEPVVRVKGSNQIEVQMPGIDTKDNPNIADALGRPAKLSFSIVHRTATPENTPEPPLGYRAMTLQDEDSRSGRVIEEQLYIKRIPAMTGDAIARAGVDLMPYGGYQVAITFTDKGGRQFADLTDEIARGNSPSSVGRLAIILDNKLISAPTVRDRIAGGSAVITGNFTDHEAFALANALNNPLEYEMRVAELYEVSPTLARDAQTSSIRAGIWGAVAVIVFMVVYYRTAGTIASLCVLLNITIVVGLMNSFGATLTLPGVAALALTVGMAVDANILIFERMREELRDGKSIAHSLGAGFEKAFSTILDSNLTTLLTALILYWLGTGPVRGFGITLSVGIFTTMLTALVTSRLLMELALRAQLLKASTFNLQILRESRIQFMDYARPAFIGSWALVALGIVALAVHWDEAFGIDFRGGDEVSLTSTQPLTSLEVQAAANAAGLAEARAFYQTPLGADREVIVVQVGAEEAPILITALQSRFPDRGLEVLGTTTMGASVGADVLRGALTSLLLALAGVTLYVAVRFEFGFGAGALVATVHDILMAIGLYIIFGEFFGIGSGQFSAPMIAAILMVVGYSINDTIIVFDRIREELKMQPNSTLRDIVHYSINRTLGRTILTSGTTFFSALMLAIFGAGVIQDFALVFLFGIATGTFSSVFIASPVFFWYHKGDRGKAERGEVVPEYDWTSAEAGRPGQA